MRVLAISYFLPPMLFPQAIQIGRLLARCPGEVGLVSGEAGESGAKMDGLDDFDSRFAFRATAGVRPCRSGAAVKLALHCAPFYGRVPDDLRGWVPRAESAVLAKLRAKEFAPDVMITFGEPMSSHLLGLRLKNRLKARWIAHFSDPWADNPFRRRNLLANIVNRRLERRVIAAADYLLFTSAETVDLVMGKYPAGWRKKCAVLPHSFDPALYPPRVPIDGPLVARYLGNFYGHRTPLPLLRALHVMLRDQPATLHDVRFELVGRVPPWIKWHTTFRALPAGLIRFVDSVAYSKSLELMVSADLLLVIDAPDEMSVFLPSKLIDYIGADVPICGITPPGTTANLLRRLGAPVGDPRRPEDAAMTLLRALRLAAEQRDRGVAAPWADPVIRNEFAIDRVAGEFTAILARVAGFASSRLV